MSGADEDRFRPKVGKPRGAGGPRVSFTSQVLRAASKAGPPARRGGRVNSARWGRGAVAARLMGSRIGRHDRRVVIKTRPVVLADVSPRSTKLHLSYLKRDAVGPNGEPGHAYNRDGEHVDTAAFEERGRDDRHQFRIIVAPEDGAALGDLKAFTRELMARMETDLDTKLDWIAVDHHDTGNPHTHVVLRGVRDDGRDLVIDRDYISHGMRKRASELATEWLGPRTEREIAESLGRDAVADRWTGIDRALGRAVGVDRIATPDMTPALGRASVLRRLRHLETLGLAEPAGRERWRLSPRHEPVLRQVGERDDIIRTMQRALGEQRELATPDTARATSVIGRIAAKGLVDELTDAGWIAVDGVDGRAHYACLPPGADLGEWPIGGIVELSADAPRATDRAIAALSDNGVYSVARHRGIAAAEARRDQKPDHFADAHVRRLEALRRAGLVERLSDDLWRVPDDLAEQGQGYDRARGGRVQLRSRLSLAGQIRAIGATWLDRTLIGGTDGVSRKGFGGEVHDALNARAATLEREGLARRSGVRLLLARDLLAQLRTRDLDAAARGIAAETGLAHRSPGDGPIAGTYVRAVDRPSGRFAMLDDGSGGFALVPWRPVMEQRFGQWISGQARGADINWDLGRTRGLGS